MICKDVLQLRVSDNVKNLFIAINIFLLYMKRLLPWAMRKMMRKQFDSMAVRLASPPALSTYTWPPASSNRWQSQSQSSRSSQTSPPTLVPVKLPREGGG